MTQCEACGIEVPAENTFCTSCGARLAGAPVAGRVPVAGDASISEPEVSLSWVRKIPLITNPYLVLQCILIPLGVGVLLGLIFWLITGAQDMFVMFLILGGFLAIVFLLVMLVLQLVTGGGLTTEFFISSEGVAHKAGSTTRNLDTAATVGSVLMGSMGGTGAGMLAKSQEFNILDWDSVRYISVYPRVRSVVFRPSCLIGPVVLYCTEENFPQVLDLVRKYAPRAAAGKL
jgi:hypothetical protein